MGIRAQLNLGYLGVRQLLRVAAPIELLWAFNWARRLVRVPECKFSTLFVCVNNPRAISRAAGCIGLDVLDWAWLGYSDTSWWQSEATGTSVRSRLTARSALSLLGRCERGPRIS